MEKFAQYGFNKSHSAAYALLTYHSVSAPQGGIYGRRADQ